MERLQQEGIFVGCHLGNGIFATVGWSGSFNADSAVGGFNEGDFRGVGGMEICGQTRIELRDGSSLLGCLGEPGAVVVA